MINFDWSIVILVVGPSLAFLISILGIFDIKKESAEKLFKECLKKLRDEKIEIWKKLITTRTSTLSDDEVNSQLLKILENEERFEDLNITLKNCRKYFDYYYLALLYLFCGGVFLGALKFLFSDFLSKEFVTTFLSAVAIISVLFIVLGMIILAVKKKKLTESFDKIISLSTSPINL